MYYYKHFENSIFFYDLLASTKKLIKRGFLKHPIYSFLSIVVIIGIIAIVPDSWFYKLYTLIILIILAVFLLDWKMNNSWHELEYLENHNKQFNRIAYACKKIGITTDSELQVFSLELKEEEKNWTSWRKRVQKYQIIMLSGLILPLIITTFGSDSDLIAGKYAAITVILCSLLIVTSVAVYLMSGYRVPYVKYAEFILIRQYYEVFRAKDNHLELIEKASSGDCNQKDSEVDKKTSVVKETALDSNKDVDKEKEE